MGWMQHLSKELNPPHAIVQNSFMARASVDPGQGLDVVQIKTQQNLGMSPQWHHLLQLSNVSVVHQLPTIELSTTFS